VPRQREGISGQYYNCGKGPARRKRNLERSTLYSEKEEEGALKGERNVNLSQAERLEKLGGE